MTTISGNSVTGSDVVEMDAEQPQGVSGSRSLATWYQNTSEHPLLVYVRYADGAGGRVILDLHINSSESNFLVSSNSDSGDGTNTSVATVVGVVPPDHYYKANGTAIGEWREQKLGAQ